MTPKEVLIAAKALIDTPEKWIQAGGHDTGSAESRCAYLAVREITNDTRSTEALLAAAIPPDSSAAATKSDPDDAAIWAYNDLPTTTHADVMAWFDRAIEAAGES